MSIDYDIQSRSINRLPNDTLIKITDYLDPKDIQAAFHHTCKRISKICRGWILSGNFIRNQGATSLNHLLQKGSDDILKTWLKYCNYFLRIINAKLNLCGVDQAYRNPIICMAAVQKDGCSLRYVPESARTSAMYLISAPWAVFI